MNGANKGEKFKFKDNQMYSSGIEHAQGQIREKTFNCSNFEKTIRNFQSDVDNLKNAAGNMIYKFGDTMPALVDDVKQSFENGNFKELPRGPIGMYIKPKDHQYSLAIEQCLGALICSFICGNYEDEKTLQKAGLVIKAGYSVTSNLRILSNLDHRMLHRSEMCVGDEYTFYINISSVIWTKILVQVLV